MTTYAIDFESYYSKECSIKTLGPLGYFSHPDFDAYMVSVVADNGFSFVGHPKDFDWSLIEGQIALSHNASFDETLYLYGVTQSWWPEAKAAEWHCTADMVAYCGLPRSLKNAAATAYNLTVDKSTRDNMSNKNWATMSEEFKKEVTEYALKDSELCLRLWQDYSPKWPAAERAISFVNRTSMQRGIPIDTEMLKKQIEIINVKLFEAEEAIPWLGDKPLLSRPAFDAQCRKVGIEPPHSLAATDADAQEWLRVNGKKYAWVNAVISWRRINSLKKKIESFQYATMPDNRYYGGLMYFGAHTGRFSGSGGNLNLQNLPKEEMFGVKLRSLIAAPAGKKLVVVDLSQIEVRTLCWLAKDKEAMAEIKASSDIYEAFAIRFGSWSRDKGSLREKDPKLRHRVKAMVLGCGYGAGAEKFTVMSGMTLKDATSAIQLYRNKMTSVTRLWRDYTTDVAVSYDQQIPLTIDLPSGRALDYGKLRPVKQNGKINYVALMNRNGKRVPVKLWGGLLAENASQALARDIFCSMLCRIHDSGFRIIFHVHDEVVVEVDEAEAEDALARIVEIMSTPPDWIPDIPVSAEGNIISVYEK
jgi:DNA polymerase I-like protein with 3'-5' exonuclease and polymerase domains